MVFRPVIVVVMLESRMARCVHCDEDVACTFLACEKLHNIINFTNLAYPTYVSIKFMSAYALYNKLLEAKTQRYDIAYASG
jgi:hypothetical protein